MFMWSVIMYTICTLFVQEVVYATTVEYIYIVSNYVHFMYRR